MGLELPGPLALGMFHETAGGYFGPYDSLVSGFDKRHRTALMMGLRQRRKWLLTQIQMSYWYQRDQRELAGPGLRLQDADGDGQIESPALFGQVGRSEIDRDPARGHLEPRVDQSRADPVLGFTDRRFGQSHNRHARQAAGDMDFHRDSGGFQPVLGSGCNGGQPHARVSG